MGKRGQFIGQVFVYVLMVVVFAGVLLFGFKAIKGLMDRGSQIELKNFEIEMKKLVDSNMHYGSSETKILSIPGDYRELCFVDKTAMDACGTGEGCTASFGGEGIDESTNWDDKYGSGIAGYAHGSIQDSLEGGSKNNVYLYPKQKDDELQVGPLQVYHQCETNFPGECPSYDDIFGGTNYKHEIDAPYQNFNCMPVIDGKVRVRFKGLGNRVEVVQLPLI